MTYSILSCPNQNCNHVQASSAKKKGKCQKCGRSWSLIQKGSQVGILKEGLITPLEAAIWIQQWKKHRAESVGIEIRKEGQYLNVIR